MNEPYTNQLADLTNTIARRLLLERSSNADIDETVALAKQTALSKIAEFADKAPPGNPAFGHIYRSTDYLSSGGWAGDLLDQLKALGVTHILNLADNAPDYADRCGDFRYLYLPQPDNDEAPKPLEWFRDAYDFFVRYHHAGEKLHVHCAAGASRAPSMSYFILRAMTGMRPEDAKATIYAANSILGRNINITYARWADEAIQRLVLL